VQLRTVMVLSHGCEMDKVLEGKNNPDKSPWLCAPVDDLPDLPAKVDLDSIDDPKQKQTVRRILRIREGNQPNQFFVPRSEYLACEMTADLRKITPIPAAYFLKAKKICSLSLSARDDLYAQLGVNFSGLLLYLEKLSCPQCGNQIDPRTFIVPSEDDPEEAEP
jgi:hypothetical protein